VTLKNHQGALQQQIVNGIPINMVTAVARRVKEHIVRYYSEYVLGFN